MKYYVYESKTAKNRAVIHKGGCGYCNDGHGCHPKPLGQKNCRWYGPFNTLKKAQSVAKGTGRKVHDCSCI